MEDTRERVKDDPLQAAALGYFIKKEASALAERIACFRCSQSTLGLTFEKAADPAASVFNPAVLSCRNYCSFPASQDSEKVGLAIGFHRPFFCSQAVIEKEED